ncbi:GNAT family N-acetyltransferase [Idiomarina xiamenensis]|uniref:GNAT family N-acetyltransferase n=1 Tax=Idiomarina xiamenensis 10-D-4 TaxID=740709 RepID=K2JBJ7_9GAMM|nr:GNAT family N-acetyltransferase [Idiomarina xiamenensis]EKE80621.1 hypothetical protein A10D4_11701 [Idiomarina xiamenensis 10-D-4]
MKALNAQWIDNIAAVSEDRWQSLLSSDYPFIQHAFLAALEAGNSCCAEQGWQPQHLLIWQQERLVAAVPGYEKSHSMGEYFFDWAIAEAYQQCHLDYYPKWVAAIPFTPVTGPRILTATDINSEQVTTAINQAIQQRMQERAWSNAQILYPSQQQSDQWRDQQQWWQRYDIQFLWHNRGYRDFAEFLAACTSRKRKQIRKERRAVIAQGIDMRCLQGSQLDDDFWQRFEYCYRLTYLKRSGHGGYLTAATWQLWRRHMADSLVAFAAYHDQQMVAAALCFRSSSTLYGRYWGCLNEFDFLHFEACYYAGIDYCIAHGLREFDAGAQGEHKLQRGFEPVLRYANYRFANTPLAPAIADFCQREQQHVLDYQQQAQAQLPFRQVNS